MNSGRPGVAALNMKKILGILNLVCVAGCAGRYGYDNLFSPNWDHRHAKFKGELIDGAIGKQFKISCLNECQSVSVDDNTLRYVFTGRPRGCTYWYDVDKLTNRIKAAQFKGTKEACSLTLN